MLDEIKKKKTAFHYENMPMQKIKIKKPYLTSRFEQTTLAHELLCDNNKYHQQQYRQRTFSAVKIENFVGKVLIFFLIFAQNIDCGYTLEPHRRGGSKSTHNLCFGAKIRTNRYTPRFHSFVV